MTDPKTDQLRLYHQTVISIWEGFCELHNELYDLACEEYLTLLASDIDKLETLLKRKETIIEAVGRLEAERSQTITRLNASGIIAGPVTRASELIDSFGPLEQGAAVPILRNLNALLIDIISKLQEQNKKNQFFLNKAMVSLREIKHGFTGKKNYTTYGADAMPRTNGR